MQIFTSILLILHFIGLAAVLGTVIAQVKDIARGNGKMLPGILHGGLLMALSGLAMIGTVAAAGGQLNHMVLGIKIVVLVGILALFFAFRKKDPAPAWSLLAIAVLSIVNIVVAVFWL